MTRRLLLSYLALTLVVLAALVVPLGILNADNLRQDLRAKVERDLPRVAELRGRVETQQSSRLRGVLQDVRRPVDDERGYRR